MECLAVCMTVVIIQAPCLCEGKVKQVYKRNKGLHVSTMFICCVRYVRCDVYVCHIVQSDT